MARVKNSENLSAVTGSVTPELREALENYRWPARKTMSEAVREGLEYWAQAQGIWAPSGAETTGEAADKGSSGEAQTDAETTDAETTDAETTDAAQGEANDATPESETPVKTTSRSRK